MATENTVTVIGNVTRDPELKFMQNGDAVVSFGIAYNTRFRGDDGEWKDGPAQFFDVTAWRYMAEHVAESISKGQRVAVFGSLKYRTWETDDGSTRSKVEIQADEVCPSLKWGTTTYTKAEHD